MILYKEMSPFRYVVASDISRFYPTVYTHSIPWSIHGKAASKIDTKSNSTALPFNQLDLLLRHAQDGQSVGLPIGPDTSRIIASQNAIKARTSSWSATWTTYGSVPRPWMRRRGSFTRTESAFVSLVWTSTNSLDPHWPLSLKLLIRNEFPRLNVEDKTKALSEIFRLAHNERDDGIVKYAIRRFDRENLWVVSWDILEDFLIRSITSFPHSIDYVARVAAWRFRTAHDVARAPEWKFRRAAYNVEVDKWKRVIVSALDRNSNLGTDAEVCWLLWMMKELQIPVPMRLVEFIISRCGAFPIVMFAHLNPCFDPPIACTTAKAGKPHGRFTLRRFLLAAGI